MKPVHGRWSEGIIIFRDWNKIAQIGSHCHVLNKGVDLFALHCTRDHGL